MGSLAAGLILLGGAPARAQVVISSGNVLPERPGLAVAYVGGRRLPIVAFDGHSPVVAAEGSRRTGRDAPISIVPGGGFGAGFVAVKEAEANREQLTYDIYGSKSTRAFTAFDATLTADRDMDDVYLLLLVYEDLGGIYDTAPKVAIVGTGVGRLEAGRQRSVSAEFPPMNSAQKLYWTALIFSGGSAIRSTRGNSVLDALFDAVDHVGLKKAIAGRSSGSHPPMVYRYFPLKFGDDLRGRLAGQTVNLRIRVAPDGTFDYLDASAGVDPSLAAEAAAQLRQWLFVPRIKDGSAEEGSVVLPVRF
jgi:hypothetical protein